MDQFQTIAISALGFALAVSVLAMSAYCTLWVGVLSFQTAAFAVVGGFIAAHSLSESPASVIQTLVLAGGAGGLFALICSPLLKLTSHWLGLATLAIVLISRVFVLNMESVTGGAIGISVQGLGIAWVAGCTILFALFLSRLAKSKFGIAAAAIREDPSVAAGLGIPVLRIQFIAYIISGISGGIGGALYAGRSLYIAQDTFYIHLAVTIIASVVLGGAYHWAGAIIGAVVFTGLPQIISQFIGEGTAIINGFLLLIIMLYLPGGLIDPLRWRRWKERGYKATVESGASS